MMGKKKGRNFIDKRLPPIPGSLRSQRKAAKSEIRSLNKQILQPIDWSLEKELQPFVRNIYQEHVKSSIRLPTEVAEYCTKHQITVNGTSPNPILKFNESSFPNYFLTKINELDYKEPTPLQAFCWPIALRGHNLLSIAKARTGSGKILAFLLPTILHIKSQPKLEDDDGPIALILTSTRARAQEIKTLADVFSSSASVRNACLMSGISKIKPSEQLKNKPEFIISTPDHVTDFYLKGELKLNRCTYVILDEADRMMSFGFASLIKTIFGMIRPDRQVLIWSATLSKEIGQLASDLIGDYVKVIKGPLDVYSNQNVTQHFHICNEKRKGPKLKELLDYLYNSTANNPGKIIIFMARSNRVKRAVKFLEYYGRRSVGLYGAIKHSEREKTLKSFTQGEVNILIATDLVGREIEVGGVSYVINFDFPLTVPLYVLRISYAGQQSKRGTAYTFFTKANAPSAKELITVLREANQTINPALEGLLKEETYFKRKCRKAAGNGGDCGLNLGREGKNMVSDQKEELKSGKRKQTLTESEGECSSAKRRDGRELEEVDDSDDSDDDDDDVESDENESSECSGGGGSYNPSGIPGYLRPLDDIRPDGCGGSGNRIINNCGGVGFGVDSGSVAMWERGRNDFESGAGLPVCHGNGYAVDRGNIAMCDQGGNNYGSGPSLRITYKACLPGSDSDETASRAKNHIDRRAGFINECSNERRGLSYKQDLPPGGGVEFGNGKRFVESSDPRTNRQTGFRSNFGVKIGNERHLDDRSRSRSDLRSDDGIGFDSERRIDDFRSRKEFDFDNRDRFLQRRSRERNEFRSHEKFDFGDEVGFCSERRSQERRFFDGRDGLRRDDEIEYRNDRNFVERRSAERVGFDFRDEKRGIGRFQFDNEERNDWTESRNRNDYDEEHGFRTDGDVGFGNERDVGLLLCEKISVNSFENDIDNASPNDGTRSREFDWIYRNEGRRNGDESYRSPSPQGGLLHDERNDFSNNREGFIFDKDEHIPHNQKTEPGSSNFSYREESPYRNRNESNLSFDQRHYSSRIEDQRKRDTNFSTRRDEKFSGILTGSGMGNDGGFPQRNARFRSPCVDDRLHENTAFNRRSDDIFTRRDKQRFDDHRNQRFGNNRPVSDNSYNRYN